MSDDMLQRMIFQNPPEVIEVATARRVLLAAGLTLEQLNKLTGFGRRHDVNCAPTDTVINKFAAGALSIYGVMGDVFGSDTVQHHRGHNVDPGQVGSIRLSSAGELIAIAYMGGSDTFGFGVFEDVCCVSSPRAARRWLHSPPVWFGDPVAAVLKARDVRP